VKALDLAAKDGSAFGKADASDVYAGKYPLARFLHVYVNKAPNKPLDPLIREFLRFVLASEGQEIVVKDGYLPIAHEVVQQELAKLD
jgi:phosphate transport system substrate-binding protein